MYSFEKDTLCGERGDQRLNKWAAERRGKMNDHRWQQAARSFPWGCRAAVTHRSHTQAQATVRAPHFKPVCLWIGVISLYKMRQWLSDLFLKAFGEITQATVRTQTLFPLHAITQSRCLDETHNHEMNLRSLKFFPPRTRGCSLTSTHPVSFSVSHYNDFH